MKKRKIKRLKGRKRKAKRKVESKNEKVLARGRKYRY
jgi:hypothetical protein